MIAVTKVHIAPAHMSTYALVRDSSHDLIKYALTHVWIEKKTDRKKWRTGDKVSLRSQMHRPHAPARTLM
jgi:hypothetical protein